MGKTSKNVPTPDTYYGSNPLPDTPELLKFTNSSDTSFRTASSFSSRTKMNVTMSKQKKLKKKKNSHNKTQRNIKKVFDVLRQEVSMLNNSSKANNTSLANDTEDSVILVNDPMKRKLSESPVNPNKKLRKTNDSVVLVNDDTVVEVSSKTPKKPSKSDSIQCSTPINQNKDMKNLIISNFPQNNNTNNAQNFNEEVENLTKEINRDSYITIDLTTETLNSSVSKTQNTVIDLADISDIDDCTVVSVSKANLSLSGESDVTVLHKPKMTPSQKQLKKAFNGLSKLNPSEKSKMLEYVVQQILGGCEVPESVKKNFGLKDTSTATQTAEDTYIKEVILGEKPSRNSIGSNIYNPAKDPQNKTGLRMIVIDGSNVAMEHGKGKVFSVRGLKICIDYFLRRGHVVKAFVPRYRCKFGRSSDPRLLDDLERKGYVVYTPSREVQGKFITSYDDRYIVQCAAEFDGIIVSGDNYRDLLQENPRWRSVIEQRLLPFTWVNDMIMFPRDPLGRKGPTLERFLRHPESPATSKK